MDGYSRVKLVGKGSFGAAYLVWRKADGKKFIEKEIRLTGMPRSEQESAKKEVQVLRNLDHPNIVKYIDHGEKNGNLHIIMEYADGGDLYAKLKSQYGKKMSEKDIMLYFTQLCLALRHLHDKRILHRDLKTQNVFLTSSGVVKLGDFGISTVLKNTFAVAHTICGTPYYFSPELCQNKPYNNKTDVWSLGCILYELTTLNHAFDGPNMKALMQKIVSGVFPPISPQYSPELSQLVNKMLSRDPAQRPNINAILSNPYVRKYVEALASRVQECNAKPSAPVALIPKDKVNAGSPIGSPAGSPNRDASPNRGAENPQHAALIEQKRKELQQQRQEQLKKLMAREEEKEAQRKVQIDLDDKKKAELDAIRKQKELEWENNMKLLAQKQKEKLKHMQAEEEKRRVDQLAQGREQQLKQAKENAEAEERRRKRKLEEAAAGAASHLPDVLSPKKQLNDKPQNPQSPKSNNKDQVVRQVEADLRRGVLSPDRPVASPLASPKASPRNNKRPSVSAPPPPPPPPPHEYDPNDNSEQTPEIRKAEYDKVLKNITTILEEPSKDGNADGDDFEEETSGGEGFQGPHKFMFAGATFKLDAMKDNDPLGNRIEVLRQFLENKLGDMFYTAFNALSDVDKDTSDDVFTNLQTDLGPRLSGYLGLVSQLVLCVEEFNLKQ